jgi:hypothetical protein
VAIFQTAPDYTKFETFCSVLNNPNDKPIAFSFHAVTDDEATDVEGSEGDDDSSENDLASVVGQQHPTSNNFGRQAPVVTDFNLQGFQDGATAPAIVEDEEDGIADPQAELLHWHHKLGHVSFHKLRRMAAHGDIPKRLVTCKIPLCMACLFGKATKRPCRTKVTPSKIKPIPVHKPGDCILVDQIESTNPGLVGQMKGFLTNKRYRCATVFVDHFSGLSYMHIQKSTGAEETVQGKQQFESYCISYGVKVHHYTMPTMEGLQKTSSLQQSRTVDRLSLSAVSTLTFKMA